VGPTGADSLVTGPTGFTGPAGGSQAYSPYIQAIAVGSGGNTILRSVDSGNTWSSVTSGQFASAGYGITWNALTETWVAVGRDIVAGGGNTILTSQDGLVWSPATGTLFSQEGRGISTNGSSWAAVGSNSGGGGFTILTSANGINWTGGVGILFATAGYEVVGTASAGWVAVGSGNYSIMISSNTLLWQPALGITFGVAGFGVAYNGVNRWVAVGLDISTGGGNTILTSLDGVTWTNVGITGQFSSRGFSVAWNGSMWVAIGVTGVFGSVQSILTSTNGLNWTPANGFPFGTVAIFGGDVTWAGSNWIATADGTPSTILTSINGMDWVPASGTTFASIGYGVATTNVWKNTPTSYDDAIKQLSLNIYRMNRYLLI
jgi:hypothetical protein